MKIQNTIVCIQRENHIVSRPIATIHQTTMTNGLFCATPLYLVKTNLNQKTLPGLDTSDAKEAKEYFSNLQRNQLHFGQMTDSKF